MADVVHSPLLQALLRQDRLFELGPGRPDDAGRPLRGLSLESLFAPETIRERSAAECCLAGLWLYHDYLDESHTLSQDIASTEGSYWHGIMHRREPDYGNAKYWFRRVGNHPIFAPLQQRARQLAESERPAGADFLLQQETWDPYAFIDLCAAAAGGGPGTLLCRKIQRAEWDLLFDFCYRRAIGKDQP